MRKIVSTSQGRCSEMNFWEEIFISIIFSEQILRAMHINTHINVCMCQYKHERQILIKISIIS